MKASLLNVSKSVFPELCCVTSKGQQNLLPVVARAGYSTRTWASYGYQKRPDGVLHTRNSIDHGKTTATSWGMTSSPVRISSFTQLGVRYASSTSTTSETSVTGNDAKASLKTELPSQEESRRSHMSKRFSHIMDNLQSNIFIAGQRLNDLTGYSGIEALKKEIEGQEELVRTTRAALQQAKSDYTAAIAQRSASQREVNELLQRKHNWSPQDLERFTSLYRSDHANEQAETNAQVAVTMAEREAEEASTRLSATILARYHEEQIWSDKIRRMSTWGTWGLMGMNVLLFMIFQIGVEPWRRKRLVKGFEEKVMEALEREGAATNAATGAALAALQASHSAAASGATKIVPTGQTIVSPDVEAAVEAVLSKEGAAEAEAGPNSSPLLIEDTDAPSPAWSFALIIKRYRDRIADLFSEREIAIRKVDLTTAAIEGTFAGLAIASVIAAIVRSR
ncbi:sensitivity to high expression protein she9 [Trapelia coarctata]|nr:sensitivity to high expression protein she9 [Trapelia coarctata]